MRGALVLLLCSFFSCVKPPVVETDAGVDAGSSPSPYAVACQSVITAYCERIISCDLWHGGWTLEACVQKYAPSSCTLEASVDAGYRRFDAEGTLACAERLRTWSACAEIADVRESCLGLRPTQLVGDPCLETTDCVVPFVCAGDGCERKCRETAGLLGEPCGPFNDCHQGVCDAANGRVCRNLPVGSSCWGSYQCDGLCDENTFTCTAAPGPGEACLPSGARCKSDSFCDTTTNLCVPRKRAGEPCTELIECARAYCKDGVCHEPREGAVCTENNDCWNQNCDAVVRKCIAPRYVAEGEACTQSKLLCGKGQRCVGLGSDVAGRCERTVSGGPCDRSFDCPEFEGCLNGTCQPTNDAPCVSSRDCTATHTCVFGTCTPLAGLGGQCRFSPMCGTPGAACISNTCVKLAELDEPCTHTTSCKVGLACVNGRCASAGRIGEPCTVIGCFEGDCNNADRFAGTCVAERLKLDAGASCVAPSECGSGFCDNGFCTQPPMACMP
jgi:hypothetical protein